MLLTYYWEFICWENHHMSWLSWVCPWLGGACAHLRGTSQLPSSSPTCGWWRPTSANTDTEAAGKHEAPSTQRRLCRPRGWLCAGEGAQCVASRAFATLGPFPSALGRGAEGTHVRDRRGRPRLRWYSAFLTRGYSTEQDLACKEWDLSLLSSFDSV